ncbi:MAG: hypothetical protein AB7L94_38745, partial [Kofleriaceae bacterium]
LAKRSGAAEFPLTPPVRRWIVMSWVVVILLNLLVGVAFLWNRRLERAYSVEPVVGDRWTIETATWPYAMFDNAKYARVIVAGVAADSIELHACDMVADNQDTVRRECTTYPLSLESIPRSELPAIYDEAIADVDTDRDVYLPFLVTGGVGIALLIGLCVLGTSWQRRLTNGGQFSACSRSSTTASCRRSPRSRWAAG